MVNYLIGGFLIVMAFFLVGAVLMQSSKDHRMGGSIAGAAETFFGKQKSKKMESKLNFATTISAIVFVLLVLILYIVQPEPKRNTTTNDNVASQTQTDDTQAPVEEENVEENVEENKDNADAENNSEEGGEENNEGAAE